MSNGTTNATLTRALMDGKTVIPVGTRATVTIHRKSPPVGFCKSYRFNGDVTFTTGQRYRRKAFSLNSFQFDNPAMGNPID